MSGTSWRLLISPLLQTQFIDLDTLAATWNPLLTSLNAGFQVMFDNPPDLLEIPATANTSQWVLVGGVDGETLTIEDNVGLIYKNGQLVPSDGGGQRQPLGTLNVDVVGTGLPQETSLLIPAWTRQMWATFGRESTSAGGLPAAQVFEVSVPLWRSLRQLPADEYGTGSNVVRLDTDPAAAMRIKGALGDGGHDALFLRGVNDELVVSSSSPSADFLPLTIEVSR